MEKERVIEDIARSVVASAMSDADIDKLLKIIEAVRLERSDVLDRYLTGEQKYRLLCLMIAVIGGLGLLYVMFVLAS